MNTINLGEKEKKMGVIVKTKYGNLKGFESDSVKKWFGVPFAKAPIGELRFRRAVEPDESDATIECAAMGPSPVQFGSGMMADMLQSPTVKSEDCLSLNIWAPAEASNCPVFVYIYGGANHLGESANPEHDLSSFAKNGVIGVSFNYRLGPLGFYNFHELDPSFDSNCAVSDMIMAMKWVHENIASFGGNPENVTICGESAGGTGVYCLLAAPKAQGYFQKAIPMSGLAGNVTTQYTHTVNNKLFFEAMDLKANEVAKLKELPVEILQKGAAAVMDCSNVAHQGIFITGPVIDDLVPDYPWEMIKKGNAKNVTLLIGTCQNEAGLFYTMKNIPMTWADIEECYKLNKMDDKIAEAKKLYGDMEEVEAVCAWGTDRMFWAHAMQVGIAQSRFNTVYNYRFDFVPVMGMVLKVGATHSMDIAPGLNTRVPSPFSMYNQTPEERIDALHKNLHGAFVAFAKDGVPKVNEDIEWKPFTENERNTMLINDECKLVTNPNEERLKFWKDTILYNM